MGFLDVRQVTRHIGVMVKKEQSPSVAQIARALVRRHRSATLATALAGRRQGWPYASLVTVACAMDASPVLLMSSLADHTRNIREDSRASLLFEEASGLPNPQTGPRVTLTGRLTPTMDGSLVRRFLARHPDAELYAGFADFQFYRMKVERAHYVGGFGRASWFAAKKFLFEDDDCSVLSAAETKILDRVNAKYSEDLSEILEKPGKTTRKGWRAYAVDPEGLDLTRNGIFRRIEFDQSARSLRGVVGQIGKKTKKQDVQE
ncbi:MAG: pyridoxamine 5'-phosphate oxidase family protein [Rhodospirillales bacterium]|nr:pyridoxamine 5'-phosphate oxidase family protein [Rhodospirillales bacterium]